MAFFDAFRRGMNLRAYQRLPAAWPIKCEPLTSGDGRHLTSTGNVSAGGVAVTVPQSVAVGSKIRVEIHVTPLRRSIQALGQVTRCTPSATGNRFELGIRFVEIAPSDRIALDAAIEEAYGPPRRHRPWWRRIF